MEYSSVQGRLKIYNIKEIHEKFINIDVGAKPFINNKKHR
jgi:hypothetical protein